MDWAGLFDRFETFLDRFGAPIAFLTCLIIAIYKVAAWMRPHADRWINSHINLMNVVTDATSQRAVHDKTVADAMDKQADSIHGIETILSRMPCRGPGGVT